MWDLSNRSQWNPDLGPKFFNLPREIQTVPRGELYVLQYPVEQATHHSHIIYVTDSKVNTDLYNKGQARATVSSNCDLFKVFFKT